MSRVVVFLKDNTVQELKELSKNNNKSLSGTISDLIDIGHKIKQHQNNHTQELHEGKKDYFYGKHIEYLLKTMAIASDIYRCVRNEQSKYDEITTDDALNRIDINTANFIKKYSNKK